MTETPARKPRPRRTFSVFGDVRRMPSEYEIVTHGQNWTLRQNRASAFEQNPSSAANLWFLTYRDNSPLRATDWNAFRDPDALTYCGQRRSCAVPTTSRPDRTVCGDQVGTLRRRPARNAQIASPCTIPAATKRFGAAPEASPAAGGANSLIMPKTPGANA